jgi:Protein of unknown function (DUF3574)
VPAAPRSSASASDGGVTRAAIVLLLAFAPAASASAQIACRADQKASAVVEMMFGRKIGERIGVTNAAWTRFVDREITPRFPDGLSVVDAAGQWQDPVRKRVVREPSKIVTIVLRDSEKGQSEIDAIAQAYKKQFRQQSVGVIVRPACVSF